MMKKLLLLAVGWLYANIALGVAQPCAKEMAGKTACVAGELMLCNKEFDTTIHDFRYEWHGINNVGQPFDIYYDSMYKKVAGLTPAACTDSTASQNKYIKPPIAMKMN